MAQKTHYLDTCIWLNLFKKEGNPTKGVPYWKIAKDFLENVENSGGTIIVSTIVLKELTFTLEHKFNFAKNFFCKCEYIKIIKTTPDDYDFARKLEKDDNSSISFYDYLHIAIARRLNVPLITRDRDLIVFAANHIKVFKPEELIS